MKNYDLFNSLCSQFEINISVCSSVRHDQKWLEHESKKCYDIWLITTGTIELETDGITCQLNEGDVFLFYPGRIYVAESLTEYCEFIFIHFDVSLGKNIRPLDNFKLSGHICSHEVTNEVNTMRDAFQAYQQDAPLCSLLMKGSLIFLIRKIAIFKFQTMGDETETDLSNPYLKLEQALSFITHNLYQDISVKKTAADLHMSEKYFISFFKKYMGITPYSYIQSLKFKDAIRYLSEKKFSVKDTAYMLGYSDAYSFSKEFKKYYGFSPSTLIY